MHGALRITEILTEVFRRTTERAQSGRAPSRRTADLAALARVCRAFRAPALDLLWHRLDALGPLVALLPPGSPEAPAGDSSETARCFWTYARRVRHLSFDEHREPDVCAHLARLHLPTTTPLCPRLLSLWWDARTPAALAALRHFLAPALGDLHLALDTPPAALAPALADLHAALAAARPPLRRLALTSTALPARAPPHAAALLGALPALTCVHLDDALAHDPAVLGALGALPHLDTLHLTLRTREPAHAVLDTPLPHPPFAALRTLVLDGDARALAHAVARLAPAAPLVEEVMCTLFGRARERDVAALLDALRGVCARALQRLAVAVVLEGGDGDVEGDAPRGEGRAWVEKEGYEEEGVGVDKVEREDAEDTDDAEEDEDEDEDDWERGLRPLSFGAIAPALGFGGLTALELALGAPLRLGAAELVRCAQAWPAMRTLELELELAP